MRARFPILRRLASSLVASLALLLAWACCPVGVAAAASPQPAFYTWQAPGGASTKGQRVIALTFDDGPGPYTPQVLAVLEQYHVPATFFEIGEEVVAYPQYTKLVAAAGYPVEDHTWTHPDLTTIPVSQFPYQIDQTQAEIRSLTGTTPQCVRPPYDSWNATVLSQIAARGLTTMSYSIDPRDWSLPGVDAIVDAVVGAAFPGAVVDMHDGGGPRAETVAALPTIITDLRAEGYSFVAICGAPPPPPVRYKSETFAFGDAPAAAASATANVSYVGIAVDPRADGYWLAAADGGVFTYGAARYHGSLGHERLNQPITAIAATPDGGGYWLVAADGGVFCFGDARFRGSAAGLRLPSKVVGIAADAEAGGYRLVTAGGEVLGFGAGVSGSPAPAHLAARIVGIAATADGAGYWLLGADGGIFSYGSARFAGSAAGSLSGDVAVGVAPDPATGGYWLVSAAGTLFAFNARWYGSPAAGAGAGAKFFGIAASADGRGYLLAAQRAVT